MPDVERRLLPAAAGLLAACCTLHLILLAAGVGALAAAATGASLVALGVAGVDVGLWWTARRHSRRGDQATTAMPVPCRVTATSAVDPPEVARRGH
jgi:hypothetical protein